MTTILRPNLEDPFNTAQQMVDNNITILQDPQYQYRQTDILKNSNDTALKKLEETYYAPQTWQEYNKNYEDFIHKKGTHAIIERYLTQEDLEFWNWWRSSESIPGPIPYSGWITRRNWYLNEVIFAIISFLFMNTALNFLF